MDAPAAAGSFHLQPFHSHWRRSPNSRWGRPAIRARATKGVNLYDAVVEHIADLREASTNGAASYSGIAERLRAAADHG